MIRWALVIASVIALACVQLSKVELACGVKVKRGAKPMAGCWYQAEEKVE